MAYHPKWMLKPTYDANEDNLVDDSDKLDGIEGDELLKRDGSLAMTGDLDLGNKNIKNVTKLNLRATGYEDIQLLNIDGDFTVFRPDLSQSWNAVVAKLKAESEVGLELKYSGDNTIHLFDTSNAANRFKIKRTGTKLQFIYYDSSDTEHVVYELMGEDTIDLKNHTLDYVNIITPGGSNKQIGSSALPFEVLYTKNAYLDTIYERQSDTGVTIDNCLIKDGKAADASKLCGSEPGVSADNIFKIPSDIAQGDIFYVDASSNIVRLPAGSSGQFLKTQGAGANPVWATAPGGWNVTSQSANYTASDGDIVLVDASSGGVTITLPSPSSGAKVRVKKTDASTNTVTVSPSATETIDGASSHTISKQYETYEYVSDGTNWYIF